MSCGPAQSVINLVDGLNGVIETTDAAISALPLKVASIPGYAEVQLAVQVSQDLKLLKELLDDPLALLEMAIPSLPLEFQQYIEEGNRLVGDTLEKAEFVGSLSEKYGNVDIGDPEELLGALNDLGGDLTKLCEIIPNIQKRQGEFVAKGNPVSGTLERPKNPFKQLYKAAETRYIDIFNDANKRADSAKEKLSKTDAGFFGKNKKEVDVTKEEQKRFTDSGTNEREKYETRQKEAFDPLPALISKRNSAKKAIEEELKTTPQKDIPQSLFDDLSDALEKLSDAREKAKPYAVLETLNTDNPEKRDYSAT